MPACGPPSILSPLTHTTSTPAASEACTVGSHGESAIEIARAQVLRQRHAGGVGRGHQIGAAPAAR